MDKDQARKMILDIIMTVDYDTWKFLQPEISEDPEEAERLMDELIDIVADNLIEAGVV